MAKLDLSKLNKAELHLVEYLKTEHNITLTRSGEVKDFDLEGDEDEREIEGYADDYASECASEDAEYRATAQDRYDEIHERENVMSERIERFRNEY